VIDGRSRVDGNSASSGGVVYVTMNSSVQLDGASMITDNTATVEGGVILAMSSSDVTVAGASVVANNSATYKGMCIYPRH